MGDPECSLSIIIIIVGTLIALSFFVFGLTGLFVAVPLLILGGIWLYYDIDREVKGIEENDE